MAPYFLFLPLPVNICNTLYQNGSFQNADTGKGTRPVTEKFFVQGNNLILYRIQKKSAFVLKEKGAG
jgi:hypothetical protein